MSKLRARRLKILGAVVLLTAALHLGESMPARADSIEEAVASAGSRFDGSLIEPSQRTPVLKKAGWFSRTEPPKPRSMEQRLGCVADHSKGGAMWGAVIGGAITAVAGLFRGGAPKAVRWGAVGATGASAYGTADGALGSLDECDALPTYRWLWPESK